MKWLLLLAGLIAGCGEDGAAPASDRRFVRLVDGYSTLAECEASSSGTGFNCQQELNLCANGGFTIIVTDIGNEGVCTGTRPLSCKTYTVGDLGLFTELQIDLDRDPIEVKPLIGANPWVEQQLDEKWRLNVMDECESLTKRDWWKLAAP